VLRRTTATAPAARALASLEQLRGQHEPFWTAVAASTAGFMEMTVGRYDDALRHLREIGDLAERPPGAGTGRFEEVFAAGARLTQREAVATVRDRRGVHLLSGVLWGTA
jgi:hypothetical protein